MTQEPYGNQWKSPAAMGISLNNGTNGLLFGLTVTRAGSQHCVCQVRKLLSAPVSMWGMWSQVGVYRTNDFAVDFREISHGDKLFDPKCRDFLWILPAINSLRLTNWWTSHLQKFTNMTCSQWGIIRFLRDESDETKEICHTNNYPLFADAKESLSRIKIIIISALKHNHHIQVKVKHTGGLWFDDPKNSAIWDSYPNPNQHRMIPKKILNPHNWIIPIRDPHVDPEISWTCGSCFHAMHNDCMILYDTLCMCKNCNQFEIPAKTTVRTLVNAVICITFTYKVS